MTPLVEGLAGRVAARRSSCVRGAGPVYRTPGYPIPEGVGKPRESPCAPARGRFFAAAPAPRRRELERTNRPWEDGVGVRGRRRRPRRDAAARCEWEQAGGPACEVLDVICFGAAGYRSSAGARFGRHADGFREALQSAGLDPGGADGPRSTRARAAIRGWNRASPPCRHEHADTRHHAELTLTQGAVQPSHGVRRAQMGERRWNKSCSNSSSPPSSGSTIN